MGMLRSVRSWAGAMLVAALLLGFSGSMVAAQESTPAASADFPVEITFVNALTSLGAVDVYINGDREEQRVIEGLEYGAVSESFSGTAPGTVIVVKQNVNWGVDRYLFSTLVPTEAGKSYVITISDFFLIPVEFNTAATEDGGARTIGVHAAAQAPAVDIFVSAPGGAIGVAVVTGLSYGRATEGTTSKSGTYDLTLTQTGTETVALSQPGVEVDEGNSYVFIIIGKPGSTEQPLTVLSVSQPTE